MFAMADKIPSNAFFIAADEWTLKDGKEWRVFKILGFSDDQ
jgi:hypothetical protein